MVAFEAKILKFSLEDSVLYHRQATVEQRNVQEQFGELGDRVNNQEALITRLTDRVNVPR